ncbi:MAG: ATP-binding protein [Planctomycetota bacterium]|jgi:NAD-dependent dihydropyrimidine dehydrogenase PreA subunit
MGTEHKHRVCTFEEAEKAIRAQDVIYVNDCFCRRPAKEGKTPWAYCGHPIETCMGFREPAESEGSEGFAVKEISQEEALGMFEEWKKQGNLFRFMEDENWICSCCACGCVWFRGKEGEKVKDPCDKSPFIEKTDLEQCTLCGDCVDVCAYEARKIADDEMQVLSEDCYGCSACEFACPEEAISMVER